MATRLPPALLPVRRDKPPACHPQDTPGEALGYQQAGERPEMEAWLPVMAIAVPYVVGFIFIINEEIFTGMQCITMHPPSN
jgi:hypothetical protein